MDAGVLSPKKLPPLDAPRPAGFDDELHLEPSWPTWRDEVRRWLHSFRWTAAHRRLAAQPLFAACSRAEIRTIAHWGDEIGVEVGRVVFRENAIGHSLVVVLAGQLELTHRGHRLATLGPGSHVGEIAILGFGPQPATVTALTPCRLFVLGRRHVRSLALDSPGVRLGLFPGLDRGEVVRHVRRLQVEGLEAWRRTHPVKRRVTTRLDQSVLTRCERQPTPGRRLSSSLPEMPARPMRSLERPVRIAVIATAVALFGALFMWHLPVLLVTPAHAIDVATEVSVEGAATQPVHGHYILMSASLDEPTIADWIWARLRGETTLALAPDQGAADRAAKAAFADSEASAVQAAASSNGIDPASLHVDFRGHELGGPSAALIYAIALADLLDPADLASGRTIAATGSLDREGRVQPVGFLAEKVAVARAAGATLLLVPLGQDPGDIGIKVIEVATVSDAIAALRAS
ncbi:MAG: hypothetical protein QOC92_237 [Acidimicrobiaceae bacterium]